jgi:Mg2+ and Co2+ transporter CorA
MMTLLVPRLDAIERQLAPRVDRLESDVREISADLRSVHETCGEMRARLEQLEKKTS